MSKGRVFVRPDIYPERWEYSSDEEYEKAKRDYREEALKYIREIEEFDKEWEEKNKSKDK